MDKEHCISVRNVSKSFRLYHDRGHTLKEKLIRVVRDAYEERQVLNGISFDIVRGKSVGLIGRNGSGKSTLLKLMTGIIYADSGDIAIQGKVSSLLELGAGFHPDFSGRDNIYINASIFGLSRREIDARYDQIVRFSELEQFIDNPVRTYSSGMYMRLAFSVAINVDADILFVDEILAVGDASFQKKCLDKIRDLRKEGKTIVIVTHDLGAVERICDEAIWLEQGKIVDRGLPKRIIDRYMLFMENEQSVQIAEGHAAAHISAPPAADGGPAATAGSPDGQGGPGADGQNPGSGAESALQAGAAAPQAGAPADGGAGRAESDSRWGNAKAVIDSVRLLDEGGAEKRLFHPDESITACIRYRIVEPVESLVVGFGIWTRDRFQCYGTNTHIEEISTEGMDREGEITVVIPGSRLVNNSYAMDVALHSESGVPYDYIINAYSFNVYTNRHDVGIARIEHKWVIPGVGDNG